eukprot:scaffold354_cov116-Isochrysis_galbana.AAC.17
MEWNGKENKMKTLLSSGDSADHLLSRVVPPTPPPLPHLSPANRESGRSSAQSSASHSVSSQLMVVVTVALCAKNCDAAKDRSGSLVVARANEKRAGEPFESHRGARSCKCMPLA